MWQQVLLLAQEAGGATGPSGFGDLVTTYGPFAPFATLLLWLLNLLWKENKTKDTKIEALQDAALNKVLPLVIEVQRVLADVIEALRETRPQAQQIRDLMVQIDYLTNQIEDTQTAVKAKPRTRKAATNRDS